MKKTDKIIAILFIVIASLFCVLKTADTVSYTYVKTKAQFYLSQKYDAKMSDFEVVDYRRAGIYWDDYNIFWLTPKWVDFCFEFEYSNRKFMVNRVGGKFYDDYQLDDLEIWCTKFLQKNIDDKIIGVYLDSKSIVYYLNSTGHDNNYIIKENDIEEFLNTYSFSEESDNFNFIYLYENNMDTKRNKQSLHQIENEISSKLQKKIKLYGDTMVSFTKNNNLTKYSAKPEYGEWRNIFDI